MRPEFNSRAIALDILQGVLRRKQPFDEAFERYADLPKLDGRDRAFVYMLVATILRRLGQIDAVIKACLEKPQELKAKTQDLLRIGACQILFLRVPAHAAVDTVVALAAKDPATQPYKNLINAVLRRLTREGAALADKQDAARLNTPDWLWLSWRKAYGTAAARAIAEANLSEAPLDLTVKGDAFKWAQSLKAELLPNGSLRLEKAAAIPELPGFDEGMWWVQDAASSLPAKLFGDVKEKTVIDLCAAPGGKCAQLAALGAHVIAIDRAQKRLERLRQNLARLHLQAEIICVDALTYKPEGNAAFILLDAPCSATGTIRRHPDVERLKTPEDVVRMADLQRRLLRHAVDLLAPGGILVYAVCSLEPEETEIQIAGLLAEDQSIRRLPIVSDEVGDAGFITASGDLRCLPFHWKQRGGIDGFFAARLQKSTSNAAGR